MFTVAKLRKKPRHFQTFTGLTPAQFQELLDALRPAYQEAERERLARQNRQRAVGAGRKFSLALPERLLMGLVYWRLYVTQGLLSYLFGLDEANVSREINGRLRPCLLDVLPTPMRDGLLRGAAGGGGGAADKGADRPRKGSSEKRKKIGTLADLLAAYPEMAEVLATDGVFVDATEQQVPKPQTKTRRGDPKPLGKAARKMRYSGKQKCHTVKTQVLTTKRLVLHMLGGLPGSVSDTTLLRASGVLGRLPAGTRVRVDKGYEGAETEYPEAAVEKPVRGQRGHTLTALGRAYNREVSRLRVPVEHMLSRTQKFGVLSGVYRSRWEAHEDTFCLVAGLVNFKALGRLAWASPSPSAA